LKRRALFLICLLAISVALVAAQTSPTSTPTPTPSVSVVIGLDVFVRGGPGRQYVPVGKLVLGDRVTPLSHNADADWVLITYNVGFGWVRRDLVTWAENIDLLPVIDEGNLTPSPGSPSQPQQTLIFLPTQTPVGNWVQLIDAPSGYVRAGPGRTYLRLGQLTTGTTVEPVGRDAETVWIMIRFLDGFGWVRSDLVHWVDDLTRLPVVSPDDLTPTATFTPTNTSTPTATPSKTATFTVTPSQTPSPMSTHTPTVTPSSLPTNTPTLTYTPTVTPSPLPTDTATLTHTPTATATSTNLPLPTATNTLLPTTTLTYTALPATATPQPVIATKIPEVQAVIATNTSVPTPVDTATRTYTLTSTATVTSTTHTPTPTNSLIPASATVLPTSLPTNTPLPPSATSLPASVTSMPSATAVAPSFTATSTTIPATSTVSTPTATPTIPVAVAQNPTSVPQPTPVTEQPSSGGGGVPVEAIVGGFALLLVLTYIAFYWRGLVAAERYAKGFVIHTCPACDRGHLVVETKQDRLLGIPRPRRTVRCTQCRSVLREVGNRLWRYAVDPMENPALYKHYNGREIDDATLVEIERQPHSPNGDSVQPRSPVTPPSFTDEDA
jgi:uncharacterized protein YgiM (DUF1202 family)